MTWGKKKYLNVAVRESQIQSLRREAERRGLSQARLVREALDLYFHRLEANPDDMERLRSHLMFATLHLSNIVSAADAENKLDECGCVCRGSEGEADT